ncbi:MAG TPA: serpin family protein [Pirellulales bacterium]|nr:serpin family protein [Pirellulales bacterium]
MKISKPLLTSLLVFLTVPARPVRSEAQVTKLPADVVAIAKDGNAFAADLYGQLAQGKAENLFFSPYSVSQALAMTYSGAAGQTEAEMAQVLHLSLPADKVPAAFASLREAIAAGEKPAAGGKPDPVNVPFQLRVTNRLWGQKTFHFLPAFLTVTQKSFGAELGLLDFKQPDTARQTINAWVAHETDDKIQDLIARGVLNADTRLVLTNAIYFKARWTNEFSKQATKEEPFHVSADREFNVPTMHQTHRLGYAAADEVQILEMPYGRREDLSMVVLLPDEIDGLAALEKRLTSAQLEKWLGELRTTRVIVSLPRFKMTSDFSLSNALSALGMPLAFTDKADFSRMTSEEPLSIGAVVHKAFVDVNEEGTEAAAATAVAIGALAIRETEPPKNFKADHPFVFLIRERRTNSILFLGRVVNPQG